MHQVLLVDPEYRSDEGMKGMVDWHYYGFTLHRITKNHVKAKELLKEEKYSAVIIHLSQFEEVGLQLCEYIRRESQIPIVLAGGGTDFQTIRQALNLQVFDYLPAPIDLDELTSNLLELKKSLDHNNLIFKKEQSKYMLSLPKPKINSVEKVKIYVEEALRESLTQKITLKDISEKLNYNYSYLGQKFKAQEKMTFNEYLLKQRMEKAKFLLESTNMKIYEIANEIGYVELDWFYKKFKSYTGVNANKYRELANSK